jgi:hypothetical protein
MDRDRADWVIDAQILEQIDTPYDYYSSADSEEKSPLGVDPVARTK